MDGGNVNDLNGCVGKLDSPKLGKHGPRQDERPHCKGFILKTQLQSSSHEKGPAICPPEKAAADQTGCREKSTFGRQCTGERQAYIDLQQDLTAKINKSIETQMVSAASAGKLTIMKHAAPDA